MIYLTIPDAIQDVLKRVRAFVTGDGVPAETEIVDPDHLRAAGDNVEQSPDCGICTPRRLKVAREGRTTKAATGNL
jgi:hypothetical protein